MSIEGSAGPAARQRRPRSWQVALVAILAALQIVLIWAYPRIPTTDGPSHRYSAWVYRQLADRDDAEMARHFERRESWLYPNASYSYFLSQGVRWLSPEAAEKLGCSLYVVALLLSFFFLLRTFGLPAWLPCLFLLTLSLNFLFFMGLMNFLWGVPLALMGIALAYRYLNRPSFGLALACNLFLVATLWSHVADFVIALTGIGMLTLLAGPRRSLSSVAAWLPAAAIAWVYWPHDAKLLSGWQYVDSLPGRIQRALSMRVATSFGGVEIPVAALLGAVILVLAFGLGWWHPVARGRLRLVALAGVMLALAIAVPRGAGSAFYVDTRWALFFWLLAVALVDLPTGWPTRTAAGFAVLMIVAQGVYLNGVFRQFNRDCAILLSGSEHIADSSNAVVWPFRDQEILDTVGPFTNADVLLALERRGPSFMHFQSMPRYSGHFPVRYSELGLSRYLGERAEEWANPAKVLPFVENIAQWGDLANPVAEWLRGLGYRVAFEDGLLRLWQQTRPVLEQELGELLAHPDGEQRQALAMRIIEGRAHETRTLVEDQVWGVNLTVDGWTYGVRASAIVVANRGSVPLTPFFRVTTAAQVDDMPVSLWVEDGEGVMEHRFEHRRGRRIAFSPVLPDSERLYIVWVSKSRVLDEDVPRPRRGGARFRVADLKRP